jgi:BirA family transcriptional regulator, biotin operon repressor / biotin---[acetyl-CoA-carboxylase] ligase
MDIFYFDILSSTNITALDIFKRNMNAVPLAVCAKTQTAGAGTFGKIWHSVDGNLHVTYLFRLDKRIENPSISLMVSVVLHQTLCDMGFDYDMRYKWPNDIYLDNKKCGGILIVQDKFDDCFILRIGIGLNLTQSANTHSDYPTACLADYYHYIPEIDEIVPVLGDNLQKSMNIFLNQGFDFFRQDWLNRAMFLNQHFHFEHDNMNFMGNFVNVSEHGHAVIKIDGVEKQFSSLRFIR